MSTSDSGGFGYKPKAHRQEDQRDQGRRRHREEQHQIDIAKVFESAKSPHDQPQGDPEDGGGTESGNEGSEADQKGIGQISRSNQVDEGLQGPAQGAKTKADLGASSNFPDERKDKQRKQSKVDLKDFLSLCGPRPQAPILSKDDGAPTTNAARCSIPVSAYSVFISTRPISESTFLRGLNTKNLSTSRPLTFPASL